MYVYMYQSEIPHVVIQNALDDLSRGERLDRAIAIKYFMAIAIQESRYNDSFNYRL